MKPKVSKSRALGLHSRTAQSSRFFNPRLSLCSEEIPFLDSYTILFLGMPVTSIMSAIGHQELFSAKLLHLLNRVDSSPVTTKQIRLYRAGVCPHLTGGFRVLELPISWIQHELESKATRLLKKWLHIPQGGNPQFLYLPRAEGGLALPALSTLYKQQQYSRHVIFRLPRDECVLFLEANTRCHHKGKFSVVSVVNNVQSHNTACSKQQLKPKVFLQRTPLYAENT